MKIVLPVALGIGLAGGPAAARAQDGNAIGACHDKVTTADIVDCIDKLTDAADKHLNVAYRNALKNIDPSGVDALRAAERAWLEYRRQRCRYLGAGPGTIGQVISADCFLKMTRDRADQLDSDGKGFGPG